MNIENTRSHFGFIGFGLIGGSIAHALRELYPSSHIMAYNYYIEKPHPMLELAKKDGVLSSICTDLSAFSECDVIFLCAPVIKNAMYLKQLAPYIAKECLITDVGSVKGNIYQTVVSLGLEEQFVGGHPMTGSENTGYTYSSSDFLKGYYYLLTPTKKTKPEYIDWMEQFVKAAGSLCMILDEKEHDRITAGISHGPHVISAALVNNVACRDQNGNYAKLAAGGFRDITRISSSSPEMWENICMTNQKCIVEFLDEYIDRLNEIKKHIQNGDSKDLTEFFANEKKYRDNII